MVKIMKKILRNNPIFRKKKKKKKKKIKKFFWIFFYLNHFGNFGHRSFFEDFQGHGLHQIVKWRTSHQGLQDCVDEAPITAVAQPAGFDHVGPMSQIVFRQKFGHFQVIVTFA